MAKNKNDLNSFIKEAIDASIEFEVSMDSTDFDSYLLEEDEDIAVKDTPRYIDYNDMVNEASKHCDDVIRKIPEKLLKKIKEREEKNDGFFLLGQNKEDEMTQCLVYQLFKAKMERLEGRQQIKWEKEKRKYIDSTHRLHKAFDYIPKKKFYENQKGKSLIENYNWAKVLYYNEMAICYSGLTESSMSLGYAEAAISILKEIQETDENRKNKLYTFALCNKGEAERNLHDYDKALRTFKEIVDKCEGNNMKSSDYNQALFRLALILIDQGRGVEAIKILEKMEVLENDSRFGSRDLEKASAFIDQKEYENAGRELYRYKDATQWGRTFTFRKAALYRVRCLLEWRKNKPKEFKKDEKREWKKEYENIPEMIKGAKTDEIEGIIGKCIDRKDGVNFKKACRCFSEFHELESELIEENQPKENNEELKELKKKELWGYFLYLFYEKMDDIRDIKDWKDMKKILQEDTEYFHEIIDKIEDTEYMKDFFYSYMEYLKNSKDDRKEEFIIKKLYNRLIDLYQEKDKLQNIEKIERKYNTFIKELSESENEIEKDLCEAAEFITTRFFKTTSTKDKPDRVYLSTNTIENRMHRNTDIFAGKILGIPKHILPSANEGVLIVLRRWNSFTPGLSSPASPSRGGGYFLYFKDGNGKNNGIVIDPGYDFLDNLFLEGFTIHDIDVVLISHAHPDHTDNFPKMLTLFYEMNGRLKKWKEGTREYDRKHIKVILSQGVFDLFSTQMDYSKESLKDIYVVDTKKSELIKCCKGLQIKAVRTSHGDLSQWESIGFIFNIENNKGKPTKIGYTSDARWSDEFGRNFSDCSIICAHLGSIINILDEKDFCNTFCSKHDKKCKDDKEYKNNCKKSNFSKAKVGIDELKKQNQDENHLYLGGLTSFFNSILKNGSNLKLGIISEFGEELKGGIRMDLFHKFDDWFRNRKGKSELIHSRCLPGDIGLKVDIFSGNVFCQTCERYVDRKKINPIAYGKEEAIFFVCDECRSTLSIYQIEDKLRDYCERGRQLEAVERSK